ncbi:Chemotaxis signal transduction protein [Halapricum desulfuricans]|uniref:Chemotaxis signal transduction protein n=1 Tax=Halapricum desulfuricans TaxID=2841257 RepID=A0A897NFR3_9EURY|nr:chemotaxis protein CheW [Halapricum desulfuricans]QSG11552.1 Chemotaxis signal transduction protein [Halapricum desulfuricans]
MSLQARESDDPTVEELQVLEFGLNGQGYCVEIETIAEIVDEEPLTAVPDSDPHVVGVMNLRDETTTIVDPKIVFDLERDDNERRIVIFDDGTDEQFGWLVDTVHRVSTFRRSDVEQQDDSRTVRGLVNRDDGFLIWVDPAVINRGSA